ncbi:uncharacterized protein [Diadema antillarum]|uniref:uncharacterized protein n=1 Tax=Diadema antillarum TaxID=105358 RepID=UPI003A8A16C6
MANSFTVLLSYIDAVLWLCTRLICGVVYIFEFNYRLVTAVFRGCIQLWSLMTDGMVAAGHLTIEAVWFLGQLPSRTVSLSRYLANITWSAACSAVEACVTSTMLCLLTVYESSIAFGCAILTSITNFWSHAVDSALVGMSQIGKFMNSLVDHVISLSVDMLTNTTETLYRSKASLEDYLLNFLNTATEYTIAGINYPIMIGKKLFYQCAEFSEYVVQEILFLIHLISEHVTRAWYDILDTVDQIVTFPLRLFRGFVQNVNLVCDDILSTYSVMEEFVFKNWYALIALGLCFTFLALVTVYLNVQHERNIQNSIRDLARLVTNLVQSGSQQTANPGEELRGPDQDAQNQRQQAGEARQAGEEGYPGINENVPNNVRGAEGGDGDGPGPSRNGRRGYSLRRRASSPVGDMEKGDSIERLMSDLKHRLNEEQDRQLCVVCQDTAKDTLFLPCRHLCACRNCAETIVSSHARQQRICPLCRVRIGSILEVYS